MSNGLYSVDLDLPHLLEDHTYSDQVDVLVQQIIRQRRWASDRRIWSQRVVILAG